MSALPKDQAGLTHMRDALDAPDVTEEEARFVRAMRTESGWWKGDPNALVVLREYRKRVQQAPFKLP